MSTKASGLRLLLAVGLSLVVVACSDPEVTKARHLEQGKAHMAAGKVQDAILEFRNALKIDPRFGEARWELAQAFETTRNPQANREFIRAADLLPNRGDVQLRAAMLLIMAQQFEQARKHADLALQADPTSTEAQILRAYTLAGLKDVDGAIAELERTARSTPGDFRAYAGLGAIEAAGGKLVEAEAAFKKAVEADPASAQAKVALAYFYLSTRRSGEAEKALNEILAAEAGHVGANRLLAMLYIGSGRLREAEVPLRRLLDQGDAGASLILADLLATDGRGAEARPIYESLKAKQDSREVAVARLAGLDFSTGRRSEALSAVETQLADTPKNPQLLALKSRFLTAEGRREEALATAKEAVAADAQFAEAHYALGLAEAGSSNFEAAVAAHNEALRLTPAMPGPQIELARLHLLAGRTDQALQFASSARKAAPRDVNAWMVLVRAQLQKGDLRGAEADARSLVQALPNNSGTHALLGRVLLARSDTAGHAGCSSRAGNPPSKSKVVAQGFGGYPPILSSLPEEVCLAQNLGKGAFDARRRIAGRSPRRGAHLRAAAFE